MINFEKFADSFSVPTCIMECDYETVDSDYIKIALMIVRNSKKNYSNKFISNILSIDEEKVSDAILYWKKEGLLLNSAGDDAVVVTPTVEKKSSKILNEAKHPELKYIIECAEETLSRPLNVSEYRNIADVLEFTNLPGDVVLMAIEYCLSIDKFTTRYFHKVCCSWSDAGITTHEQAEKYLRFSKNNLKNEDAVKKLFGIENRNLTENEKKCVLQWFNEYNYDIKIISAAYEKCVSAISKLSIPYINQILKSWYDEGVKTATDIKNKTKRGNSSSGTTSYDIDEFTKLIESGIYEER